MAVRLTGIDQANHVGQVSRSTATSSEQSYKGVIQREPTANPKRFHRSTAISPTGFRGKEY
jgi:hypothetical protein